MSSQPPLGASFHYSPISTPRPPPRLIGCRPAVLSGVGPPSVVLRILRLCTHLAGDRVQLLDRLDAPRDPAGEGKV